MRQFIAKQTFEASETKSTYLEGFSYTIRPGNRLLNALAELWFIQGKIHFLHDDKRAEFKGNGFVINPPPEPPPVVIWAPILEPVPVEETPQPVEHVVLVEMSSGSAMDELPIQPPSSPPQDPTIWEKTRLVWRSWWQ